MQKCGKSLCIKVLEHKAKVCFFNVLITIIPGGIIVHLIHFIAFALVSAAGVYSYSYSHMYHKSKERPQVLQ
jgi:hypothetical protein